MNRVSAVVIGTACLGNMARISACILSYKLLVRRLVRRPLGTTISSGVAVWPLLKSSTLAARHSCVLKLLGC